MNNQVLLDDPHDPGPVPEGLDEPTPTLQGRLVGLQLRAMGAQDRAGWADLDTPDGLAELASAFVELSRIVRDLLTVTGQLASREKPQ